MKEIPKIELHCHLDGSLRIETIIDIAEQYNIMLPTKEVDQLKKFLVAPIDCDSLDTYLQKFDLPISVMQNEEALCRTTFELVEDNALENVKYLEIRFNPFAHMEEGLSLKEVIESVLKGCAKGEAKYDIKVNMIVSFSRLDETQKLYELIEVSKNYINQGLVAIDLCAVEKESFVRKYIKPIKVARLAGLKVTVHAGETGYSENVVEAIEYLNAKRIGHGVAIIHDHKAMDHVLKSNVHLEICPTSNIQTKAFSSYKEHPVNEFLKKGIKFSIGTDNRLVSNVSLTDEFTILKSTFAWDNDVFAKIYYMSIESSFASSHTKDWLRDVGNSYFTK